MKKPLFARYKTHDHLISGETFKHSYIVEFEVKFENGGIKEIRLNTSSDYKELISCEKTKNGKLFQYVDKVPWHEALLGCWNNEDPDSRNSCLYTFTDAEDVLVCTASKSSQDDLVQIFPAPAHEPQSSCLVL